MFKSLVTVAALLISVQSSATSLHPDTFVASEVMELLVRESKNIQLRSNGESDSDMKLDQILASHMMTGSYVQNGKSVVLTSTMVDCKNVTNGRLGAQSYVCSVSLLNGDFKKSGSRFQGPLTESAVILNNIKVFKAVAPHSEMQLSDNKIDVMVAG